MHVCCLRETGLSNRLSCIIRILALVLILNSGPIGLASAASTSGLVLTRIAQVDTGDAYDVRVDTGNQIAYVTCGYSGMRIFDISDPHNPAQVGYVSPSSGGYAHQLAVRENLVFIADGYGGIKIVDVTNYSSPVVLGQYIGYYAWDVEVVGNTAFAANTHDNGLTIVNVTDSTAPSLLGSHTTVGGATDLELVGDLAFVTTGYGGFTVFDVSDVSGPVQLAQYTGNPTAEDIGLGDLEIVGDLAFLSYYESSFKILNISDISSIEVISEFNETSSAFSVHVDVDRSLAFVCDLELGLLVLDIGTPSQPTEIARYFDGGKPNRVRVVDDLVYMTDQDNGFVILEIGEDSGFTLGIEPLLLVIGAAVVLSLGWWMRKSRTTHHAVHQID